jgi:hypothetical protein
MTNISPTAAIPEKDTWRINVRRFPKVMKLGAINEKRINSESRIRNGTFFFMSDVMRAPKVFEETEF